MSLFHEPDGRGDVLRHPQPRHHHAEPPPREPRDPDFPLDFAGFGGAGEDAHAVEFFQHDFLGLDADGVGRVEVAEGVG